MAENIRVASVRSPRRQTGALAAPTRFSGFMQASRVVPCSMGLGYKRTDLQAIAQAKLDDATILLQNGRFSNAYYLAGYAVEIGLKACIAKQISAETIPDKSFINQAFNHNLKSLVGLAGLSAQLGQQQDADPVFAANWALVGEWTPEVRYEAIDPTSAQQLTSAIVDPSSGVLQWIKMYW